ncbi:uncharacterized protein ColSpa_12229 [Colletotrichum spaethianum]|uniref:Chromo domain-containing protein n=1 Tax=Colletotrichum spaethianum TaxID=700344 RepID=A0AA37PH25_9PEZI|nr:uncharacterized protein ColSpa_12229 [Colletotrichum spaethianum]GKT52048.1 hypothetical protein ColSpa_12229 [Colletotrichum spaethianum]
MADKNLWHVLEVEKHKQTSHGNVCLYISWIGSPERSWEPESRMMRVARAIVEDYWIAKGGRDKVMKSVAVRPNRRRRRFRNAAAAWETSVNAQAGEMRPDRPTAWKRDFDGHQKLGEVADEVALAVLEAGRSPARTERVAHEDEQPANSDMQPPRKRRRLS